MVFKCLVFFKQFLTLQVLQVDHRTLYYYFIIIFCRLHEFKWHGEDRSQPGRFIPGKNQFTQLCHVPSQFYCNVRDVRTNDDTLITVKLMLFYEMVDVETMVTQFTTYSVLLLPTIELY